MPSYDWERPLADLKELAELTGGPDGARRLAWSEDWRTARKWLLGKLEETDATVERDVAGNLWATIPGARPVSSSGCGYELIWEKGISY